MSSSLLDRFARGQVDHGQKARIRAEGPSLAVDASAGRPIQLGAVSLS